MNTTLQRSSTDKIIGGVCGGLGRHFGIDTIVVRLAFLASIFLFCGSALLFVGGVHQIAARLFLLAGLAFCFSPLVYLILWVVMPKEPAAHLAGELPGTRPIQAPIAALPQLAYNPTGEWKFDPYTGQPIDARSA
jgi:phage shock protein C